MISCHNCGTDNLDGSEYCDECGVRLHTAPSSEPLTMPVPRAPNMTTPQSSRVAESAESREPRESRESRESSNGGNDFAPPEPPVFTTTTGIPKVAMPTPSMPTSAPPPQPAAPAMDFNSPSEARPRPKPAETVAQPRRASEPTAHLQGGAGGTKALRNSPTTSSGTGQKIYAKLVISRGGNLGKEFPVAAPEAQIGRWDADNGIFPDIDLDQFDPEAKVSRRHARIVLDNGQYMLEDLGSTNGTFINRGRRLIPGSRQPLRSGDELIVGKTFLKFIVEN